MSKASISYDFINIFLCIYTVLQILWKYQHQFSSVQLLSCMRLSAIPWTAAHQASPFITNSQRFYKLLSIESVMPFNHLILCHPHLLPPSNFPRIGIFQWVSSSHQMTKLLEFQLHHQSFQWIFRTDFLYNVLIGSLCSPRDSQESSPTLQFKSYVYRGILYTCIHT